MEQVLKIECNISITTNYMLSGVVSVRIVFGFLCILVRTGSFFYTVPRSKIGEKLPQPWPTSCLLPKITNVKASQLSYCSHGPFCLESRYWQEGQDHGAIPECYLSSPVSLI